MNFNHQSLGVLWLGLAGLALPTCVEAEVTHLAVVVKEDSTLNPTVSLLIESQLEEIADVRLVDRQHVTSVLAEARLALSGLADPMLSNDVRKLIGANLFVVIESNATGAPAGVVVIDSQTGVRLADVALSNETQEASIGVREAVVEAMNKRGKSKTKGVATVATLTVRNASLPKSQDAAVAAMGRLIERALVQSPSVALLERARLAQYSRENSLPTAAPLPPLVSSIHLLELEFRRGKGKDGGCLAIARISQRDGKPREVDVQGEDLNVATTKLARVILAELRARAGAELTNSAKEAARFYRQSQLRSEHDQFDLAREDAEAAYALDGNDNHLTWLIRCCGDAAIEQIDPGQQRSGSGPASAVSLDRLTTSLHIAQRGLDLTDLWHRRLAARDDWPMCYFNSRIDLYFAYLPKLGRIARRTEDKVANEKDWPAKQQRVQSFLAEYQRVVIDELGDRMVDAALTQGGQRQYLSWLSSPAMLHLLSTFADAEMPWSNSIARLMEQFARVVGEPGFADDPQRLRSASAVIPRLRHRALHMDMSPKDREQLLQVATQLADHKAPLLQAEGRLLRLTLQARFDMLEPAAIESEATHVLDLFTALIVDKRSARRPTSRMSWAHSAMATMRLLPLEKRTAHYLRLFDQWEKHNVVAPTLLGATAAALDREGQIAAQLDVLERGQTLLELNPPDLSPRELSRERQQLASRIRAVRMRLNAETSATPWLSAKPLIDVAAVAGGSVNRPVLVGRDVFALIERPDQDGESVHFHLRKISLDSKPMEAIAHYSLHELAPGAFGSSKLVDGDIDRYTVLERSTLFGSYFIRDACVDQGHYLVATMGRGIWAFSLEEQKVRAMTEAEGLPSDFVQALTAHNGQIFAWLGRPGKEAYLVRMKGDFSDLTVLSSSQRAIRQSPLDDVEPVECDFMMADVPRERVVFRLTNSGSCDVLGLWEADFHGGPPRQLQASPMLLRGFRPRLMNGQLTLKDGDHRLWSIDLATDRWSLLLEPARSSSEPFRLTPSQTDGKPPLFRCNEDKAAWLPLARVGGDLWVGLPFGRIHPGKPEVELFESLRGKSRSTFQPGVFVAQPTPDELLVADPNGMWLLKLR